MICETRAYKCYIPRMNISGFDLHKRLDVGIGLAQSVKFIFLLERRTLMYNYFHRMITLKAIDQLAWQHCIVQK